MYRLLEMNNFFIAASTLLNAPAVTLQLGEVGVLGLLKSQDRSNLFCAKNARGRDVQNNLFEVDSAPVLSHQEGTQILSRQESMKPE